MITEQQIDTEKLSALYDRIYDIADRLFKKYNPCNHIIKEGIILCTGRSSIRNERHCQRYNSYLCCNTCKHLSATGCTVKCLPCKLFMCSCLYGREKNKITLNKLYQLKQIASKKYGIDTGAYYHTKKEVLDISKRQIERKNNSW